MLFSTDMSSLTGLDIMIEQSFYRYHVPNGTNTTLGHDTDNHIIFKTLRSFYSINLRYD